MANINGTVGGDLLEGTSGDDTIVAGIGADYARGGLGHDTYVFNRGDGQDTIDTREVFDASTPDLANANDDVLLMGPGIRVNDVSYSAINGGYRLTIANGSSPATDRIDLLFNSSGLNHRIQFDGGQSLTIGSLQQLVAWGGSSYFFAPGLSYVGTAAADSLLAWDGPDTIDGLAGDDTIQALAGNDLIRGGAGNDLIERSVGNDTIFYARGDGADTVGTDSSDTILFDAGISLSDVVVLELSNAPRNAVTLQINQAGAVTGDRLTLSDAAFSSDLQIKFADGSILTGAQVYDTASKLHNLVLQGTEQADALTGRDGNDTLNGLAGHDTLVGLEGDDVFDGGLGNDLIDLGAGRNTVTYRPGDGDDTIIAGAPPSSYDNIRFDGNFIATDFSSQAVEGGYRLSFGSQPGSLTVQTASQRASSVFVEFGSGGQLLGRFSLFDLERGFAGGLALTGGDAADTLQGGLLRDTLLGGGGADVLKGSHGDDLYQGGAGDDLIIDQPDPGVVAGDPNLDTAGSDTYLFGRGDGVDTVIDVDTAKARNTIQFGAGIALSDIERITRVSEGVLDARSPLTSTGQVLNYHTIYRIKGTQDEIRFVNQAWDRHLLRFADGTLVAAEAAASAGINLTGTAEADLIWGSQDKDTIQGGLGDDTLVGGSDVDQYIYTLGDGNDLILGSGRCDTLEIHGDLDLSSLTFRREITGTYALRYSAGYPYTAFTYRYTDVIDLGGQGTIKLSWAQSDLFTGQMMPEYDLGVIERLQLDNGQSLSGKEILQRSLAGGITVQGTAAAGGLYGDVGDDLITGGVGNDTLMGNAGNDTMLGGGGNDEFWCGPGNDLIDGGTAGDTYYYRVGDGADTVLAEPIDTIVFGSGITKADVVVGRLGAVEPHSLVLQVGKNASDSITLRNAVTDATLNLTFNDGSTMTSEEILALATAPTGLQIIGTAGDDALIGQDKDDLLKGLAGNDTLAGGQGNDTLIGADGDDTLAGGDGADQYIYTLGGGNDVILDRGPAAPDGSGDTLVIHGNLDLSSLKFHREITGTFISRYEPGYTYYIKEFTYRYTDVIDLGGQGSIKLTWAPSEFPTGPMNPRYDLGVIERLLLDNGQSLSGQDLLQLSLAGGVTIQAAGASDILYGDVGNDLIMGGEGDDTLMGKAGNDTILGGEYFDELWGGPGDDQLDGGMAGDVYRYQVGDGADTVQAEPIDTILFGSGITKADVVVGRLGAVEPHSLVLQVGKNASDSITLRNAVTYATLNLKFNDGSTMTSEEILALATVPTGLQVIGTANDDTLTAVGNAYVDGGAGNDLVNSTLASTLTVRYAPGNGIDTVKFDAAATTGTTYPAKVIEVDASFFPEDISAKQAFAVDPVTGQVVNTQRIFVSGSSATNIGSGVYVDDLSLWTYHFLQNDSHARVSLGVPPHQTFMGTTGNDSISLTERDPYISMKGYGGDGNDTLQGGFTRAGMVLSGDAGDDVLLGSLSYDTLRGGTGNDLLDGKSDIDLYRFQRGWGHDTMVADTQDWIQLGSDILRSDLTFSLQGASVIIGIKGTQDSITLPNLGNWDGLSLKLGDGSSMSGVEIIQQLGLNELLGTTGNDSLQGSNVAERLQGLDGDDTLLGAGGNDLLSGGAGLDLLDGGQGDDLLDGGSGKDTLIGGGGSNQMNGGAGGDVFVISAEDTRDVLTVTDGDIIRFAPGVKAADVKFILRSDATLRTGIDPSAGQVVVTRDAATPGLTYSYDVLTSSQLNLVFSDGTYINNRTLKGTAGNDVLSYWDGVEPGAGDDLILPGFLETPTGLTPGGITTNYSLGDGMDTVRGLAGVSNSVRLFNINPGDVRIGAGSSMEHILLRFWNAQGGLDVDNLSTINFYLGPTWTQADFRQLVEDADNLLTGTGGNDTLQGGLGNDTLNGGSGNDVLYGGAGLNDLTGGEGQDTYVLQADEQSTLHVDAQDTVVFGQGITHATLERRLDTSNRLGAQDVLVYAGASNANLFFGSAAAMDALALSFADGSTWKNHALRGTEGNDSLAASVQGGDSLLGLGGDDKLTGSIGSDTLIGGAGADTLTGGAGADVYEFDLQSGNDLVHADGQDTLLIRGVSSTGLSIGKLGATGADIAVLTLQGGGTITLDQFSKLNGLQLRFDDGKTLAWSDLLAAATKPDNLTLTGTTKADTLTGKAGNDTLSGLAGNDTLAGGKGNDSLMGGKGNDTYLFNRGEGQDVIVDTDSTWFNSDLLKLGGATSKQLWLTKSGSNLDIKILGTSDKVTVQNWFAGSANQVEKITASDGKSLSAAKVQALVSAMASFTPPADAVSLPANTPSALTKLVASSWA